MPDPLLEILSELRAIRAAVESGPAEGLDAGSAAALCGVSRSKWHELVSRGLAPEPAQLGDLRCPRWPRAEVAAWLRAGAPSRSKWNEQRMLAMRRAG